MRKPPFKLDGRIAVLRWRNAEGKKRFNTDRAARCMSMAAQQSLAGTGTDFEARLAGHDTWHPIEITPDEAYKYLSGHFTLKGARRVALRTRERRVAAGKPVLGQLRRT